MNRLFKANKLSLILGLTSALCLSACGGKDGVKTSDNHQTLNEQLEAIKPQGAIDLNNIAGDTETEKLLYLLDVPTTTKAGILIFINTQIDSFEAAGHTAQADAMRENRALLSQAVDENMAGFIKESAVVYNEVFTPEEIKALTALYSQPVLQKFTRSVVPLQQKAIPIAQKWSEEKIVPRFEQLVKEQQGHGHDHGHEGHGH